MQRPPVAPALGLVLLLAGCVAYSSSESGHRDPEPRPTIREPPPERVAQRIREKTARAVVRDKGEDGPVYRIEFPIVLTGSRSTGSPSIRNHSTLGMHSIKVSIATEGLGPNADYRCLVSVLASRGPPAYDKARRDDGSTVEVKHSGTWAGNDYMGFTSVPFTASDFERAKREGLRLEIGAKDPIPAFWIDKPAAFFQGFEDGIRAKGGT